MNNVVVAENISKSFFSSAEEIEIFKNLSFSIERGSSVAVVGESGVGKSTLLHVLGLLTPPTSGELMIDSVQVLKLSEKEKANFIKSKISFVFQFFQLFNEMTLFENIFLTASMLYTPKEAKEKTDKVIEQLGLAHRKEHIAALLSGGEKQRTAIARAIIKEPAILFADEPTGNLDEKNSQIIMELLFELKKKLGFSLVLVTHNGEIAQKCDTIYKMKEKHLFRMEGKHV